MTIGYREFYSRMYPRRYEHNVHTIIEEMHGVKPPPAKEPTFEELAAAFERHDEKARKR